MAYAFYACPTNNIDIVSPWLPSFTKSKIYIPQRAIAFSLNEEFSKVIQDRMDYYNSAGSHVDSILAVQNQIEDVKGVMVQNIEKVLECGEKIELLVDKTDRLNHLWKPISVSGVIDCF